MLPTTGNEIGLKLCKLFGLPKGTKSFDLHVAFDEIVSIKCEYYPDKDSLAGIDLVTAKFELVEIFEDTDYKGDAE